MEQFLPESRALRQGRRTAAREFRNTRWERWATAPTREPPETLRERWAMPTRREARRERRVAPQAREPRQATRWEGGMTTQAPTIYAGALLRSDSNARMERALPERCKVSDRQD